MLLNLLLIVSGLSLLPQSWAQVIVEEVLSAVIFTTYGVRFSKSMPLSLRLLHLCLVDGDNLLSYRVAPHGGNLAMSFHGYMRYVSLTVENRIGRRTYFPLIPP